jgi:hypothetical protein
MSTCASCNTQNQPGAKFCVNCGAPMSAESGVNAPVNPPAAIATPPPNYPPQPIAPYQNTPYPVYASRPPKDRSIAIILEILPGLFGFLGFGWMYAGNTSAGAIWLICFLLWTFVAVVIDVFTAGFGVCLTLPVSIILIVVSTVSLSNYTRQHQELFGI